MAVSVSNVNTRTVLLHIIVAKYMYKMCCFITHSFSRVVDTEKVKDVSQSCKRVTGGLNDAAAAEEEAFPT